VSARGQEITHLLDQWCNGTDAAFDELYRQLEPVLKAIVRTHVLRSDGADLAQPTALLDQVLLRLTQRVRKAQAQAKSLEESKRLWESRQHFLSHIVLTARSVRFDALRRKMSQKEGAGAPHVSLSDGDVADRAGLRLAMAHMALDELGRTRPELAQAFVLRSDFGFTYERIADAMDVGVERASGLVEEARRNLREMVATIQPETAYRFLKDDGAEK